MSTRKLIVIGMFIIVFFGLYFWTYPPKFVLKNRYYKAYQYEQMAKKFPPGSEMNLRLLAVADALRRNQKTYSYDTKQPSFMGPAMPK